MANLVKGAHYDAQIHSALLRGAWADPHPGKAPNAAILTWPELLRKFRKHCQGQDEFANVVLQTQALELLLLRSMRSSTDITPFDLDGDIPDLKAPLNLGDECQLSEERLSEARECLEALKSSTGASTSDSVQLLKAHYAYALGNTPECLAILSEVDLNTFSIDVSPNPASTAGGSTRSRNTLASAATSTTLESALSQSVGLAGSAASTVQHPEGDARTKALWLITERLRARCEQGMAHEKSKDYVSALQSYDAGVVLIKASPTSDSMGRVDRAKTEDFNKYREIWRWSERLLRRRAIIAAKLRPPKDALPHVQTYRLYSILWSPRFRPLGAATVLTLYLEAMCKAPPFRHPSSLSFMDAISLTTPIHPVRLQWYAECRVTSEQYRKILDVSTNFPRAGEYNILVNDFVDLVVAVWDRGGCIESEAEWVIEILWWATRLTFHSHRILRHLTRLLISTGNFDEARRTFALYVQLVTKARQTALSDSPPPPAQPTASIAGSSDRTSRSETPAPTPSLVEKERKSSSDAPVIEVIGDGDDDAIFVDALVFGMRMLCRYGDEDDVHEANRIYAVIEDVMKGQGLKWNDGAKANVVTAHGILCLRMTEFEHDANTRPKHLSNALASLRKAIVLNHSSPAAHFHLALAQSALRDVEAAVASARLAVELAPKDRRTWHLLALLLTAEEDWDGARAVLEICMIQTAEPVGELSDDPEVAPGVNAQDFGHESSKNPDESATSSKRNSAHLGPDSLAPGVAHRSRTPSPKRSVSPHPVSATAPTHSTLLDPEEEQLPSPLILQYPLPSIPFLTRIEHLETSMELLLTQLAIIERMDGAEEANEKWPSVFAFFAENSTSVSSGGSGRASADIARAPSHNGTGGNNTPRGKRSSILELQSNSGETGSVPRIGELVPPSPVHSSRPGAGTDGFEDVPAEGASLSSAQQESRFKATIQRRLLHGHHPLQHLKRKALHRNGSATGLLDLGPERKYPSSAPDLHTPDSYQASSIQSRRRSPAASYLGGSAGTGTASGRMSPEATAGSVIGGTQPSGRPPREARLLSQLWLTSAATFRRMGRIDQAHSAIKEAERLDPENPNVWVQLGLYFLDMRDVHHAAEALTKALVINPDNVSATVHLAQIYLSTGTIPIRSPSTLSPEAAASDHSGVDMAAGVLESLTRRAVGWDVPEAWYFLGKAVGLQGRKERQKECLTEALRLDEGRPVRSLKVALPPCL